MPRRASRSAGFTLIEVMLVIGLVGILAALAWSATRAMTRNSRVDGSLEEIALAYAGQRLEAVNDQQERVVVFVDRVQGQHAPWVFVLTGPTAAWNLAAFDPATPATNVSGFERLDFSDLLSLVPAVAPAVPPPFSDNPNVSFFEPTMTTTCGGATCFAVRYLADGTVRGDKPDGTDARRDGFGFVVGSDLDGTAGAKRRAILVGFPTGVTKNYVP